LGHAGCFSFYPSKNLGAYGDGGMLVTNDAEIAEKVRMLRNYGQREKYHHVFLAYNRRLDTLQAAVLRVKLRRLDEWNAMRQRTAQLYSEFLQDQEDIITLPRAASDRSHVYHLYVIQHPQRDALLAAFHEQGISAGIHYPLPVHLQPCYEHLNVLRGSLPITESLAPRVLSLPMFPEISVEQVQHVCNQLTKSYGQVCKGAAYSHS
jgi:dTDP-4-amino-4,6-dideoxygalactose transaminase